MGLHVHDEVFGAEALARRSRLAGGAIVDRKSALAVVAVAAAADDVDRHQRGGHTGRRAQKPAARPAELARPFGRHFIDQLLDRALLGSLWNRPELAVRDEL